MIAEWLKLLQRALNVTLRRVQMLVMSFRAKGKIQLDGMKDRINDTVNWERHYRIGSGQHDQVVGSNHKAVKGIAVGLGQLAS